MAPVMVNSRSPPAGCGAIFSPLLAGSQSQ
jgi:hypothetical protein